MKIFKHISRRKKDPLEYRFIGEQLIEKTQVQLFTFDKESCEENSSVLNLSEVKFDNPDKKYWLNFHGIHETEKIGDFCSSLGIHRLAIQDILDTNQRPKFQAYENFYFFSIKAILPTDDTIIAVHQLSFILSNNFLISFQERNDQFFDHVRDRIREDIGIVRERNLDYLFYLLIEAVLDTYLKTFESFENRLEVIHNYNMSDDPSPSVINSIEELKSKIYQINKMLLPVKEFLSKLERESYLFVEKKHQKYYHELKDLCLQISDYNDSMEKTLESKINLFFSFQGQKMNQVMKTLTIVSTIFIPLTFIAGVYGMNFKNMPELESNSGYFITLFVMVIVAFAMVFLFKKKKLL